MESGQYYLAKAHAAYEKMQPIRAKRERNKNFTYGNQWSDCTVDDNGNTTTEYAQLRERGKEPLTNNLIRQLVKSVVGRFRNTIDTSAYPPEIADTLIDNAADELDCRAMEEFLISGCCFQKAEITDNNGTPCVEISNVSPAKMFINAITDPRGRDCMLIGELHDMPLAEIVHRLADGSRKKATWICETYGLTSASPETTPEWLGKSLNFYECNEPGKLRVIEIWTQESREYYECHNRETGEWFTIPANGALQKEENTDYRWTLRKVWRCRWITPSGTILSQYDSPFLHGSHPYAFKLYPLTDGEVHSLVEDVIDQQKYVNRLITLVDHIMGASAKGVLLYPDTMLPEGYTWHDLRHAWSKPDSIIPYHPRTSPERPQQISTNATNIGAYDMLNLQMKLFEQISGVSGVLQGQSVNSATGVKLYESQIENSTVALSDIFESFNAFRRSRNAIVAKISAVK